MRKSSSSLTGRPSLGSGPPLRVRPDNMPSSSGASTSKGKEKSRSLGGPRPSVGGRGGASSQGSSGRMSFLPKTNRPSSGIGVRGRTDVPKDPRPTSDKKWQRQNIEQLLEFLVTNSYPHPISLKLLQSPTSKDFFKIFAFIYNFMQPGYKMVAKMEEEVPRVLRLVAYPFTISKTYLYSVGSPHTWPHLLAALTWMLNVVTMADAFSHGGGLDAAIFGGNVDDFDCKSDDHIKYEYNEKTYDAFMKGADDFPELDAELQHLLKQKYQGESLENMEEENNRMEMELNQMDQEEESLHKTREKITTMKQDERLLTKYLEDMDRFKAKLAGDVAKADEGVKMMNHDLEHERERLQEMQLVHQAQDLTPSDVARMKDEQGRLRQQVEQVEKQVEDMEADNWKVQMEISKVIDEVEKEVAIYNREAIKLKLVPETAALAQGRDFRLKAGYNSDIERLFEENIKPVLKSLKIKHTDKGWSHNKELFSLQCKVEKCEESLVEAVEKIANKEKELANLEAEISSLKTIFASDKQTIDSCVEDAQRDLEEVNQVKGQLEGQMAEVKVHHSRAAKLFEERKKTVQRELNKIEEKRQQAKSTFEAHKAGVEAKVRNSIAKMRTVLEQKQQSNHQLRQEAAARDKRVAQLMAKRK